ncbi:MAG: hypothetical protein HQ546_01035 [Planctomycetes bacterium]|nr:hypothetical protein [Planctomycetota bacterium]
MSDRPIGLNIFRTALPMRAFQHACASREVAEAVVVSLRTESGRVGWGEALPRSYVTGETLESVPDDIEKLFWPPLRNCRDGREVAVAVGALPCQVDGRAVTAARCAVELAAIQAFDLPWVRRPPGGLESGTDRTDRKKKISAVHISGVLGSADPRKTARTLRRMRWYALRSFKLKLGFGEEIDRANLRVVHKKLRRHLQRGRCTLRVDVNGAWKYKDAPRLVEEMKSFGVFAVEQPCTVRIGKFVDLAMQCSLPLIADESCITAADADVLLGAEGRVWLNVRICKNGGLGPALAIAEKATQEGVPYVLGCMVGESAILSMAQRAFLTAAPPPVMLEGNYGRFLLKDDLADPSPRFGLGGRLMLPATARLDPQLRADKLRRYGQLVRRLD